MQIKRSLTNFVVVAFGLMCSLGGDAHAAPSAPQLAKLFSDHMVLQQNKLIRIWGFDAPGTDVTVTVNGLSRNAAADKEGAWCCLQKVYGKTTKEACGPMFHSRQIQGEKLIITFNNAGEGLKSADGEASNWFEVSDGSRKNDSGPYVYAKAVARMIGKNQIEVHSPDVAAPKPVRFSWHMFARNNLVNSEGLPAFPFRTDDYKNPKES